MRRTAYFPVIVIKGRHKGRKMELKRRKKKMDVSCILQKTEELNKGRETDL